MIYLFRHGETEWNVQQRKQGLDDSPLTSKGHDQSAAYGEVINQRLTDADIILDDVLLYVSPLERTQKTAQYIIDALNLPQASVHIESRLIEFDYGDWSGLTNDEIEQRFPGQLSEREENKWNFTVPNGESYADVETKACAWMSELPEDKTVLAVTHSVVSRVVRGKYLGLPRHEAGKLIHHQDSFFSLYDRKIEAINIHKVN